MRDGLTRVMLTTLVVAGALVRSSEGVAGSGPWTEHPQALVGETTRMLVGNGTVADTQRSGLLHVAQASGGGKLSLGVYVDRALNLKDERQGIDGTGILVYEPGSSGEVL